MAEPLLQVKNLVKRFGGLVATNAASFSVASGEIHALIGPNGAGKTTMIHLVSGGLAPDAGEIVFDGIDLLPLPMHLRVRRGLARSYQITNIFPRCTVIDNIALAVQARSGSSFRFWRPVLAERPLFDEAQRLLEQVGLQHKASMLAGSLAHGEQRRLELGITLATQPKLLLLDEPMAGMGQEDCDNMVTLLRGLKGRVTILLVEHDMGAVFRLADSISVLVYGQVIASGLPDAVRADPAVQKAYLGEVLQ